MRYFKPKKHPNKINWIIKTDDNLTKYSSNKYTNFDDYREFNKDTLKMLKDMWIELTKDEAFMEML